MWSTPSKHESSPLFIQPNTPGANTPACSLQLAQDQSASAQHTHLFPQTFQQRLPLMSNPIEDPDNINPSIFNTSSVLPLDGTFNLESGQQSGDLSMLLSNADVDQSMDWALEASKHPIVSFPLHHPHHHPSPTLTDTTIQPFTYIQQQQQQPDSQYQDDASPTKRIKTNTSSLKRLTLASTVNSPIDNTTTTKQQQQKDYNFPTKQEKEAAVVNGQKEHQPMPSTKPPQPSPPIVNVRVQLQIDGKVQLAEMQCEQLIKKLLTATDTGRLGRIILPRYQVENHLPVASCIEDRDAGLVVHAMELGNWQKKHALTLKYWVNGSHSSQISSGSNTTTSTSSSSSNKSKSKSNDKRMWLFEGTKDLVAGKKPGDCFCLYRAVDTGHYFVDC